MEKFIMTQRKRSAEPTKHHTARRPFASSQESGCSGCVRLWGMLKGVALPRGHNSIRSGSSVLGYFRTGGRDSDPATTPPVLFSPYRRNARSTPTALSLRPLLVSSCLALRVKLAIPNTFSRVSQQQRCFALWCAFSCQFRWICLELCRLCYSHAERQI